MSAEPRLAERRLACIGLSFHEIETTRLVVGLLSHRLVHRWRWAGPEQADAVVVDPRRSDAQSDAGDIRPEAAIITLLEHNDHQPATATRALYRPFRPRSLIHALNHADEVLARESDETDPDSPLSSESAEIVWQSMSLLDAILEATRHAAPGMVIRIAGVGDHELIIDAERDTVRGPARQLSVEQLVDGLSFDVAMTPRSDVEPNADADERQLCTWLLDVARTDDRNRCLFGDMYRTKVRLDGWPDLSSLQIDRGHLKAVTLVRHAAYTVAAAAAFAGANPAALLPLFNATYLNGNLLIDDGDDESQDGREPPAPKSSSGVLGRIRAQIGMG